MVMVLSRALAVALLSVALGAGAADRLLVVNKNADTVSVLSMDSGEELATIATGIGPHEIAASPDGRRAVVGNYGRATGGNSLTVIDLAMAKVSRTIDLGTHTRPHGILFLADGKRVAVTTEGSRHLLVVDVESGKIEQAVDTGQEVSHMVALSPSERRAYVANIGSGSMTVIDLADGNTGAGVAAQVPTGDGAEGIALTPDGREIWISNRADDTVSVVEAASLKVVATLRSPGFPIRVAMSPDGRKALVTNAKSGELAVFDVATRKEIKRLRVVPDDSGMISKMFGRGSFPIGVVVSPAGDRAFVALAGGGKVAVLETKTWTVTGYWTVGDEPDGMAITAN